MDKYLNRYDLHCYLYYFITSGREYCNKYGHPDHRNTTEFKCFKCNEIVNKQNEVNKVNNDTYNTAHKAERLAKLRKDKAELVQTLAALVRHNAPMPVIDWTAGKINELDDAINNLASEGL